MENKWTKLQLITARKPTTKSTKWKCKERSHAYYLGLKTPEKQYNYLVNENNGSLKWRKMLANLIKKTKKHKYIKKNEKF